MFSASLMSENGERGRIVIKVEGSDTAAIWTDGREGSYGFATGLVIVECAAGGRVWMECAEHNTRIHASPNYHYTTFSGMLVHAF